MNKFLKFLFAFVALAMVGASVLQLFFPSYMANHSGYGFSVGWQRDRNLESSRFNHDCCC